MGYNSISIDELCYLAVLDFYNPELISKLNIGVFIENSSKLPAVLG